jgi:hypothetical protein
MPKCVPLWKPEPRPVPVHAYRQGRLKIAMKKQKPELTWIGKEKQPKLEPRILLEEPGPGRVAPAFARVVTLAGLTAYRPLPCNSPRHVR